MKWNLIIMLLYSFMWKLQEIQIKIQKNRVSKWKETWLLCFYTHSCERFKIVQIKIQKGQSIRNEMKPDYYAFILIHVKAIRNEMKWNMIIMLLYSFMWKLQNSPNQNTKTDKV